MLSIVLVLLLLAVGRAPLAFTFVSQGQVASLELGQAAGANQFNTKAAATTQAGENEPRDVNFDPSGNLWVTDTFNNRVVEYASPFSSDEAASIVLGQSLFTTNAAGTTATGEDRPRGAAFDSSGNLWVADATNNRVIEYKAPFSSGEAASIVLGQSLFTTNAAATTATGESNPRALAFDSSGNLWVDDSSNNRVIEYKAPFSNGEAASIVLGQSLFTTNAAATTATGESTPLGIAFDSSGNLWLADLSNNRVIEYTAPFSSDEAASMVIGQSLFTTNAAATTQTGLNGPGGVAFDSSHNLWVTEGGNRILEYNAPLSNDEAASIRNRAAELHLGGRGHDPGWDKRPDWHGVRLFSQPVDRRLSQ